MRDLIRLLKYVKPYAGRFVLAVVLTIFVGLFETGFRALLKPTFDRLSPAGAAGPAVASRPGSADPTAALVQEQASKLDRLSGYLPPGEQGWYLLIALFPLFAAGKGLSYFYSNYLMGLVGLSAIVRIRQDLYEHILNQSAAFFNRYPTNALTAHLTNDVQKIELAVTRLAADLLREFFKLVGYLVLIFMIDWKLTLMILLLAPVISYITTLSGRRLRRLSTSQQVGSEKVLDVAQETIAGNRVVKAFGMEQFEARKFLAASRELMRAGLRTVRIDSLSPALIELIAMAGVAALFLYVRPLIFSGELTVAGFLTYIVTLFSLYDPVRKLSRNHNHFQQAFAASTRVFALLDTHTEMSDRPGAVELGPLRRSIEFRDVSFKYEGASEYALRGVNLTVKAGEVVALVGMSGAGKSTLTNLLLRYFDATEGQILIDGVDIRAVKLASLRAQMGLVTQEVILFNDTVRNNIAYGRPEVSPEQLEAAARAALAHDFIMERPDGYEATVGERGLQLSGGQRQRLAIARALLKDAPILVLDEATSSLDTDSEVKVQRALANLLRGRTTIVVAHRLSTVRRADKIVVLEEGRVVETGSHEELLEYSGVYRRLYDLQFAEDDLITLEN